MLLLLFGFVHPIRLYYNIFNLISIINAASIFGRILPGILADRIGAFNVQFIFTIIMSISILAYWMPFTSPVAIITFGVFVSGAFVSLFTVCCAMISPIKRLGGRYAELAALIDRKVRIDVGVQWYSNVNWNPNIGGFATSRDVGSRVWSYDTVLWHNRCNWGILLWCCKSKDGRVEIEQETIDLISSQ
jgi:hypothetical protein